MSKSYKVDKYEVYHPDNKQANKVKAKQMKQQRQAKKLLRQGAEE